jgi:hypothetical protein
MYCAPWFWIWEIIVTQEPQPHVLVGCLQPLKLHAFPLPTPVVFHPVHQEAAAIRQLLQQYFGGLYLPGCFGPFCPSLIVESN